MGKTDLHIHTRHSDGLNTVADVARRGRRAGVTCGICDHVSPYHLMYEVEAFDAYVADVRSHELLLGAEYCIGAEIPVDAERLGRLDYLLGGVHSVHLDDRNYFFWSEDAPPDAASFVEAYTATLLAELANGPLHVVAHPTYLPSYLQDRYDEIWTPARCEEVFGAAARAGVALEISGRWLVPREAPLRVAAAMGLTFSLGSDAHRPEELFNLEYPLAMVEKLRIPEERIFWPRRKA